MPITIDETTSKYFRLYSNSKRLGWDPARIDLSRDRADWEMIRREYAREQYAEQIHRLCALFYEGEESVTKTLSPYLSAIARAGLGLDKEMFLTSQIYEEARHFEFFARYFLEVLGDEDTARHLAPGPRAVLIEDLDAVSERIRREDDPERLRELLVEGVVHYMGIVEAMLARTGYRGVSEMLESRGWLPGLLEGFKYIRRDEGRHVSFGIHFVEEMVAREPRYRDIVEATFERHLPNVLETVNQFDFEHPLVDLGALQQYALDAYVQFMASAGIGDDGVDRTDLATDLEAGQGAAEGTSCPFTRSAARRPARTRRAMSDAPEAREGEPLPPHGPCFVCGPGNPAGLGVQWFADRDIVYASHLSDVRWQGPPAHVHGGVSAALLDEAMGAAVWRATQPSLLASLNVNYLRPVPLGTPVRIEGWLERVEGRKCYAAGRILLPDGGPPAVSATGLYVHASAEFLAGMRAPAGWGPG